MKTWQKILSLCAAVLILCIIFFPTAETADCCLCDCFRYHAPCLIDLQTGQITELAVYAPHETKVAELAEDPFIEDSSFLRFGEVSGYFDGGLARIEIDVPVSAKTKISALCKACRKQQGIIYAERYVLADLYNAEAPRLFPLSQNTAIEFRCYTISVSKASKDVWNIIIQGNLQRSLHNAYWFHQRQVQD